MFGDRNLLCLDWDERSLRLVEVSLGRGSVRVRHAVHVPIEPGVDAREPAMMGDFIRKTMSEHRIRTKQAIIDASREDVILHRLSLPYGTTDEMAAMVHIQIAKELPFNKDSAVIDFAVSRTEESATCDVWVAAARNNIIDYYQQTIQAANLRLERIGLRPYANLAGLVADGGLEGRTLFVDVGASMTEINIIRDDRLTYSRSAAVTIPKEGIDAPLPSKPRDETADDDDATIPLAELAPEPSPTDNLLVEVSRTIEAYRVSDPGARIDRIILAGTCGVTEKLTAAFEKRFRVPARLYEPSRMLKWRGGGDVAAFSAVFGLAIGTVTDAAKHFDFLHPKEPEAGKKERSKRRPRLVAAVALFAVAAGGLAYRPIHTRHERLSEIETEIDQLEKDEDQREDHMEKLEDVDRWREQSIDLLDHLAWLAKATPSNEKAYVTGLRLTVRDDEGYFTVNMDTRDEFVATGMVDQLSDVKNEDDKPVFYSAVVGKTDKNKDNAKYPIEDTVTAPIVALRHSKKK